MGGMAPRWRVLAVLTFVRLGMGFQFQSVAAVSPFLSESLGFDAAQIALPAEVLSPAQRAPGMGLFYTVLYLGVAVFPALGGYLLRDMQASASPIWLAVALALATIVSMVFFRRAVVVSWRR